jgi:hypothetical protein
LSINNSAVVSGNQDRSYGFSVRCIQAQGVTVFSDPVADPDRFDVFVTGGNLLISILSRLDLPTSSASIARASFLGTSLITR